MTGLVLKDKGKGMFLTYIQNRINNNQNFLFAITGGTGSGKTYSALSIAERLDPDFDVRNICFTGTDFMELINGKTKELKKGSVIVFDEIQISLGHLDYQSTQSKIIHYVLTTFRHRNFILIVTTPHFGFINAGARKLFHCRAETRGISYKDKFVKLKPYILQVNQTSGDIYTHNLRIYIKGEGVIKYGMYRAALPSEKLIEEYEKAKDAFTSKLNEDIMKDLQHMDNKKQAKTDSINKDGVKIAPKMKNILDLSSQGYSISEISTKLDVSKTYVYETIHKLEKKGYNFTKDEENRLKVAYGG